MVVVVGRDSLEEKGILRRGQDRLRGSCKDSFSIRVRIIYSGTNTRKLSGVFPGFHNFPSLICWSMAMQFYHRPLF